MSAVVSVLYTVDIYTHTQKYRHHSIISAVTLHDF